MISRQLSRLLSSNISFKVLLRLYSTRFLNFCLLNMRRRVIKSLSLLTKSLKQSPITRRPMLMFGSTLNSSENARYTLDTQVRCPSMTVCSDFSDIFVKQRSFNSEPIRLMNSSISPMTLLVFTF
jgi:hypothetical protein